MIGALLTAIPLPYRILAVGAIAVAIFGFGYQRGAAATRATTANATAKATEKVIDTHNHKASAGQQVEAAAVSQAAQTETVFNKIDQGVIRHARTATPQSTQRQCVASIPFACRLDADGLRLWSAANAGRDPDAVATGRLDAGMSATARAGLGRAERPAGESRGGDAGVSPLPATAPGAGGVAEGHGKVGNV